MDKLYEDLIYLIVEYLDNNDRLKARLAEKIFYTVTPRRPLLRNYYINMYEVLECTLVSCEYCERIKCADEMMVVNTKLQDCVIIEPKDLGDERGFFWKHFKQSDTPRSPG